MPPKSQEAYDLMKDERREKLLSAALRVLARRGLAATRIGDIAAEARASHGLVYYYFQSKEDIFIELVRRARDISTQSIRQIDALPLPPLERIRQMAHLILDSITAYDDSAFYFLLMIQASVSDTIPDEARKLLADDNTPMEVLVRLISAGQAAGAIHEGDPIQMALLFWAAIEGVAIYKIQMGNTLQHIQHEYLMRIFAAAS
ncbi:MAG TPA: TetR/AcrR family transcriptional regulator [Anaerolineaceae bacterium]|nr:TetR/AcrR family transcriptional regulator [Anaerolineaceae bacterium]HPN50454.1 TetR/AcrR family transcriptional regulator [Anaerolineaceae bacterium]